MVRFGVRIIAVALIIYFFKTYVALEKITVFFSNDLLWAMFLAQPLLLIGLIPVAMRLSLFACNNYSLVKTSCKACILSSGLNLVIPARLSEFIKPVVLQWEEDVKLSKGVSALLLERFTDLILVLFFSLITFLFSCIKIDISFLIILVCCIMAFLIIILLIHLFDIPKLIPWNNIQKPFFEISQNIMDNIKKGALLKGIILGSFTWLCSFASVLVFFKNAGSIDLEILECATIFVATTVALAVPALPSGIGSYEAGAIFVLKSFGYTLEEAVALSVGLHISQLASAIIITAIILFFNDYSLKQMMSKIKSISGTKDSKICG